MSVNWIAAARAVAPRLLCRVQVNAHGCWLWTGYCEASKGVPNKYGRLQLFGRKWYTHIVAWMLAHQQTVPPDYEVDHRCRETRCCNPEHLELVHRWENKQRRDVAQGYLRLAKYGYRT